MNPRYLYRASGRPLGHGEASTGGDDTDMRTRPAPRCHDGRWAIKDGHETWEALLAGSVTVGDAGRPAGAAALQVS